MTSTFVKYAVWVVVACAGAVALGTVALGKSEHINAVWLLVAALCTFAVSYRFYSKFIAEKIFVLDDKRITPAHLVNDGKDYVPTEGLVVFGHHFAAIAGAGPLVGPILAAQFGYLPGTLWIIVGVCLAGAVQDFVILAASMRRNGKSLPHMCRDEIGPVAGTVALAGDSSHYGDTDGGAWRRHRKRLKVEPLGHFHAHDDDTNRHAGRRVHEISAPS